MAFKDRKIVCLCGSTRFPDAWDLANAHLTWMGCIVLSVGSFGHVDRPRGAQHMTGQADGIGLKGELDRLHFDKIEMADEILVINPGGYVGSSTAREIAHARSLGKTVRYMFGGA